MANDIELGLDDPVIAQIAAHKNATNARLQGVLQQSVQVNPDQFAQAKSTAKFLGYPTAAVETDPTLANQAKVLLLNDTLSKAPKLKQRMTDDEAFAKLSHDDTDTLANIEQSIKQVFTTMASDAKSYAPMLAGPLAPQFAAATTKGKPGRALADVALDPVKAAASGVNTMLSGFTEAVRLNPIVKLQTAVIDALMPGYARGTAQDLDNIQAPLQHGQQYWLQLQSPEMQAKRAAFNAAPIGESISMLLRDPALTVDQLAQSTPYIVPGAAAGRAGAGATLGYNTIIEALDSAASARQQAQQDGATPEQQDAAAAKAAIVTAPLVFLGNKLTGAGKLESEFFKGEFGEGWLKSLVKEGVSGAVEEGANQFGQNVGRSGYMPGIDLGQGVGKAAAVGGVLESTHGAAMKALSSAADAMAGKDREAQQAQQHREALAQLDQLAAASKLRARDPEAFQQFVKSAIEDGPVTDVYIDAKALADAGAAQALAQASPTVAGQLDEALASGGSVRVPFEEYAANIAGTELSQAIVDHVKLDPNGMTFAESEAFQQRYKEEFESLVANHLAAQSGDENYKASMAEVKDAIKTQLDAAGHTSASANDAYATLTSAYYGVRAAQLGVSPKALFERKPLGVSGQSVTGDTFTQDGKLQTDTDNFKNWFGDSKVVDSEGKPLIVFHGTDQAFDTFEGSAYFTDNKEKASQYSGVITPGAEHTPNVMPVYLMMQNPKVFTTYATREDIQAVRAAGKHDGVIVKNLGGGSETNYVSFNPEQIKSAVGNNGNFSPNDPSILNQLEAAPSPLVSAFKAITENDDIYQYGKSASKDLQQIFEDIAPGLMRVAPVQNFSDDGTLTYQFNPLSDSGKPDYSSVGFMTQYPDGKVELNVSNLGEGKRGAAIYSAVSNYAYNNGLVFAGDREGISPTGMLRRLENMISTALKFGTSDHIEPHPDQAATLGIDWQPGNTEHNLEQLLLASYRAITEGTFVTENNYGVEVTEKSDKAVGVAKVKDIIYDIDTNKFVDKTNGREFTDADFRGLAESVPGRQNRAGSNTLKRSALTNTILEAKSRGASDSIVDGLVKLSREPGLLRTTPLAGSFYQGARGQYNPSENIISLLKGADLSTFLHELGHAFLAMDMNMAAQLYETGWTTEGEHQLVRDADTLLAWFGIPGETEVERMATWQALSVDEQRGYHEKFAEGFEAYLFTGEAPNLQLQPLFQRFRAWLSNVYRGLMSYLNSAGETLTPEVRAVMDRMLATPQQIETAQQARSMAPLFRNAEEAGMTPEAYTAYLRDNLQTSQDAIQALEARSLKDMTWTSRLKDKTVKRLNKEAAAIRRDARIDARREVMLEPVYRAWAFLTGKYNLQAVAAKAPESKSLDPAKDILLVAVAKLGGINKADLVSEWGVDPKEKEPTKLFGKVVFRKEGGRSIETMAELLLDAGYLSADDNGKYDLHEFEDKFIDSLRGVEHYSYAYDYQARYADENIELDPEGSGRLNRATVEALVKDKAAILDKRGMLRANGIPPDMVAQAFGFNSGEALVNALANAAPLNEEIEALTDRKMLEEHGELSSPAAIARSADAAIHNEVRTKIIATELAGLQKAQGSQLALSRLAKEYAAGLIGRTKLKDLRPNKFATDAAKAGKLAEQALRKGDRQAAIIEKRNQLVNHATTKAAYEAQATARSTIRRFRKIANSKDENLKSTHNMDLANAAKALLAEYGIGARKQNAREYMDLVKAYDPELYNALEADLVTAQYAAKPVDELTIDELQALNDQVESLWTLARRERQVEIDGKRIDRDLVTKALSDRLDELGVPERAPGEGRAVTEAEKSARLLRGVRAAARRVESWVDRMDGGKTTGAFRSYIFTPISEAADRYRAASNRAIGKYRDLLKAIEPGLNPVRIEAPELGYTFGHSNGDAGMSELLHAIGHTGNQSNKRKLLLGRGWATETENGALDTSRWDNFIKRMIDEGRLTKAHFDFVQSVWDLLEETKPLAQETHREVFGRYFAEVTADAFTNHFGTYRGGYLPAVTDTFEVQDAAINNALEDVNAGNSYMFPATNRGFTKARVEYNRPLALDLRLIPQHLDKVLMFSLMERHVRDVQRILRGISGKLNRYDQVAYTDLLLPWLNRSAKQIVVTPTAGWAGKAADKFFTTMRTRAGMSTMFANVTNALQQITGFSITALKVKPTYLRQAMAQYIKAPSAMSAAVAELSPFMKNRLEHQAFELRSEIEHILLTPGAYQKARTWASRHAYFLQGAAQNVVDVISWHAAYDQALAEGAPEVVSIREANAVVRETQGSTNPEDVSRWETGPAWARVFTQFAGYFNMQANLLGTEFAKVAQDTGLRKGYGRAFYIMLLGFLVPAYISEAIVQGMRGGGGDGDDEYLDEFLNFFLGAPVRSAAAMVPVAGPSLVTAVNAFNDNPNDDRLVNAPAVSVLEAAYKAPQAVTKAVFEEGSQKAAVKDTLSLVTMLTGVPVSALSRPVGYLADINQNRVEPTGPVDFTRGLVTGVASADSKR